MANNLFTSVSLIIVGLAIAAATGCQDIRGLQREGSPAAPATQAQVKHRYQYYPDSAVYMDTDRKLFFYHNGEKWMTTPLLPAGIQVDWKNYVVIEMDTDKPYRNHAEIVRKYPPGQRKKREGAKAGKE